MNMKKVIIALLAIMSLTGCKTNDSELTLLVGTYTDTDSKGIYSFRFNQDTGESSALAITNLPNPSFLTVTPDKKIVYSVTEQQVDAAVSALSLDVENGTMKLMNTSLSKGRGTCHVTFVGKDVVATNYSSGSMSVFPLKENGELGECKLLEFFESGPDTVRQTASHIHSSQVSPDGRFLFVIDLGGDCIYRYPVKDGKVADYSPVKIKVPAGQGPRHFTFSKDGRFMYVVTELGGDILGFDYNDGDLKLIQDIEADSLHARGSADIHFSPDGRFLYSSHRLKGDGIAIFSQDPTTGMLKKIGYQETGIHPRNFAITPNGKYLIVACRDSNVIQVFERDPETGMLKDARKDINVPHPVCLIPITVK